MNAELAATCFSISKPKTQNSKLAFTLVELLVVIMIILIIAAFLLAAMGKVYQSNYKASANSTIRGLYTAIDSYYLQNAAYPTSADGKVKYDGEGAATNVLSPLMKAKLFSFKMDDLDSNKALQDPWDQPYLYVLQASKNAYFSMVSHPIVIYSCGFENYDTGVNAKSWSKDLIICKPDGK